MFKLRYMSLRMATGADISWGTNGKYFKKLIKYIYKKQQE